MTLRQRFSMHLRMSHGSTYGYDILDEAGKVVGYKSMFVPRNRKKDAARTVYSLGGGGGEFVEDLDGFTKAYERRLEQRRRDEEWNAAGTPDVKVMP